MRVAAAFASSVASPNCVCHDFVGAMQPQNIWRRCVGASTSKMLSGLEFGASAR